RVPLGSVPLGEVLAKGWPMMIRSIALLTAITATTWYASRLGAVDTAAHQVALQVWLFLAFVLDSFAVAAMAMVGSDLGAEAVDEARDVANRLLALGLVTGVGLSVLVAATAPVLPAVFGLEPEVAHALRSIYPFVIVLQPLTALVYVWDGVAIGAAVFRYLSASMVVSAVAAIVTLVLIGDSLVGVWWSLAVLTVARLVTLWGWHRLGVLGAGRGPSLGSPGV
ncbi:MAG: MATE family efflux transporter, partial [Acidimicrobiia bacterium]|nr:MATE family efflux transporter [Acidimicrobiia bacterium]